MYVYAFYICVLYIECILYIHIYNTRPDLLRFEHFACFLSPNSSSI